MRHILLLLSQFCLLALTIFIVPLKAQTISIEGRILSQDSVPQAGYKTQLFSQLYLLSESRTDTNGKFSFTEMTISKCHISVHKMGVRKEFYFSFNQPEKDTVIYLDLSLDLSTDSLEQLAANYQLGQGFNWFPQGEQPIASNGLIGMRQLLGLSPSYSGDAQCDFVLILAERPFEANDPTVGTMTSRASRNIQGSLASIPNIVPTPDPSETNILGIRSRPPLPDLTDRKKLPSTQNLPIQSPPHIRESPKTEHRIISLSPPPIVENDQKAVSLQPLSTFSVDVDQASYTQLRASIAAGTLPPASSIRTEELINYFDYQYPEPKDAHPIALNTEVSPCPWNSHNQLVRISLKAKEVEAREVPPSSFVFLIDVSGSMSNPKSLPLIQKALGKMMQSLRAQDQVAIAVYAGASGLVLPLTRGDNKSSILSALNRLKSGGSTNGGEGIKLAYKIANEAFIEDGNNRVILCTDGDFNLGLTATDDLVDLIKKEREKGVFLSALRVGYYSGNDDMMEKISNHGNGVYHFLDSDQEAERVLVEDFLGTTFTVAKDVKLQIEFNPRKVNAYRLIGYEDRLLANADFDRDAVDAGDMGAGHKVTALYEITPYVESSDALASQYDGLENLKYAIEDPQHALELLTVRFRYKKPNQDSSQLLSHSLSASITPWERCSPEHRWASVVSEFSMLLRGSYYLHESTFEQAIGRAYAAAEDDPERLRFIEMMIQAQKIKARQESQ